MIRLIIVPLLSCVAVLASDIEWQQQFNCYEHNIDYVGTNLNNGLEEKLDTAAECQVTCQITPNCEGFTWVSKDFFDPDYHRACWLKKDITDKLNRDGAISGPRVCDPDPDDGCCQSIYFGSTGSLTDSVQNHVIGYYHKHSDGPGGRYNYEQNDGYKRKLFYNPELQMWFVGDTIGSNAGYAVASGAAKCPQDLAHTWEYWGVVDDEYQWVKDPKAQAECRDQTPAPDPDKCVTGSKCDGCGLIVNYNGEVYCCNNHCDFGSVSVDPNQDPMCQCSHD